jgi:two-component sensor histidine kinase
MREGSQSEVQALTATLAAERARRAEADHRARNSLQLVIALLQLLGRRSQEAETRTALNRMQQWVSAIAATHRDLTDDDRFDLTRFVREQAPRLAQNEGEDATIRLNLDQVETDAKAASPLALIVCELTANALRHGRRAGGPPTAAVELRSASEGLVLTVADEGAGPLAVTDGGFGLTMVRLLVRQLAGTFELLDAQPGLRAVVRVG